MGAVKLEKIRGFVVSDKTGEPLEGVAVSLILSIETNSSKGTFKPTQSAGFGLTSDASSNPETIAGLVLLRQKMEMQDKNKKKFPVFLGTLYSDRFGYASFYVPKLNVMWLLHLYIGCPYGLKNEKVPLLMALRSIDPFVFELRVDPLTPRACSKKTISIQNPDFLDWEISPKSFANNPEPVLGEKQCETMLHSTHAVHDYYFRELSEIRPLNEGELTGQRGGGSLMVGVVKEYRQSWFPIGHALGDIIYSLALAPCESVNLAVIDWSREDKASRLEDTEYGESLEHNQRHDRIIDEIVNATVSEIQSGESSMWGLGGALGANGIGITGAYGQSSAISKGKRTLSGDSVQNIADTVSQISNMQRRLRSTVIVQATQKEKDVVQTRTVFNHNHGHALTVQYYEVLRHMKVVTDYIGKREVVFIPYDIIDFDRDQIIKYSHILRSVLLDTSLLKCFDAVLGLEYKTEVLPQKPYWVGDEMVKRVEVKVDIGGVIRNDGETEWDNDNKHKGSSILAISIHYDDDWKVKALDGLFESLEVQPGHQGYNETVYVGDANIKLGNIKKIELRDPNGRDGYTIDGIWIRWFGDENSDDLCFGSGIPVNPGSTVSLDSKPIPPEPPLPAPQTDTELTLQEKRLTDHLKHHSLHYSKAIHFLQNPDQRLVELSERNITFAGKPLIYQIENAPIAAKGRHVGFPLIGKYSRERQSGDPERDVRIIGIPTRGVFAETMLSSCNAIEKRDITRYWNWMENRCQSAPEIQGIQPGSRNVTQDLQPSSMPSPVVQIMNTPSVPDPTGLGGAFGLLGQMGPFRDMSGMEQLSRLLHGLVSGSINLAQAKDAAKKITSGSGEGRKETANLKWQGSALAGDPAKQADWLGVVEEALDKGLLTKERANKIVNDGLSAGGTLYASAGMSDVPISGGEQAQIDPDAEEMAWAREHTEGHVEPGYKEGREDHDILILWNFDVGGANIDKFVNGLNFHTSMFSTWRELEDKVAVFGYTSLSGTEETNQALSLSRALKVKDWLVSEFSFDESRILEIGSGVWSWGDLGVWAKDEEESARIFDPETRARSRRVVIQRIRRIWALDDYDRALQIVEEMEDCEEKLRLSKLIPMLKDVTYDDAYINGHRLYKFYSTETIWENDPMTNSTRIKEGYEWVLHPDEWEANGLIFHARDALKMLHPGAADYEIKRKLIDLDHQINELINFLDSIKDQQGIGTDVFLLLANDWIVPRQNDPQSKSIYSCYK